eukprot:m.382106 g.382106  ORF g.382106 m.382106 type:complete len:730 (-) comp20970_c1_seq32:2839-5028(-)
MKFFPIVLFPFVCVAPPILAESAPKPHIVSILQDDLGYYDSGISNSDAAAWSGNITALAKSGIVLTNHYTHWHCSPTRRSFLTGRLPIHHGEQLSGDDTDDIDLRMEWVSDKLKKAGYKAHWFGKWHTGFRSMKHLGIMHGFNTTVGSFQTGGPYSGPGHSMRWEDDHPIYFDSQFTNLPQHCNVYAEVDTGVVNENRWKKLTGEECDASDFKLNTKMQCGSRIKRINVSTAAECCAACNSTPSCTHWVHDTSQAADNCHVKAGTTCDGAHQEGSTSGVRRVPPGPPPPSGGTNCTNEYSTDLWGQSAVRAVRQHDLTTDGQLYVHLCFQAVHSPYNPVPGNPTGDVYHGMLWRADVYVGELVAELHAKGIYNNTLIVYSSDNGGVLSGINFPLRGEKHSNWEGGMRTAAFVSGGFIPPALRGTTNGINMHIVDWYATFAYLAGQDPTDDPPVAPLPVDLNTPWKDIYGNFSFPAADGVNVWPMLMDPQSYQIDSAHKYLVLSKEVVIAGKWKLLVSQPHFKSQNNGWKSPNGTWRQPTASETLNCQLQDVAPSTSPLPVPGKAGVLPCLFDLRADPGEHEDLSAGNIDVVHELWTMLNTSVLGQRDCSGWSYKGTNHGIPGPWQPDGTTRYCVSSDISALAQCNGAIWVCTGCTSQSHIGQSVTQAVLFAAAARRRDCWVSVTRSAPTPSGRRMTRRPMVPCAVSLAATGAATDAIERESEHPCRTRK